MDTTVREHIRRLEDRLRQLHTEAMNHKRDLTERNRVEAEIRAVNLVLSHYQTALELEKNLSRAT